MLNTEETKKKKVSLLYIQMGETKAIVLIREKEPLE